MSYPPRITDESVFASWMGHEVENMNGGVVTQRTSPAILLVEKDPGSITRMGEKYHL
jgi:hypothetical protein